MQRYEDFRSAGKEWLDKIPSHWDLVSTKRGYEILLGKMLQPNRKSSRDIEVPYLKSMHVQRGQVVTNDLPLMWATPEEVRKFEIISGDLLVCEGGEVGRSASVGQIPEKTIIQNAIHRVRGRKSNSTKFLGYVLDAVSTHGWFDVLCNKSTIAHFTGDKFGALKIPLPPKDEQGRIVTFLDQKTAEIDDATAKKERLIELLQEQKNIRIHQVVLRGLNPEVPLVDSGVTWIGAVPAHWKVVPNRFIFREQNARSLRGEEIHLSMSQRYGLVPAKELDVQTLQSESYDGAKLCQKGDLVQNRLKAHLAVFAVAPCHGLVSPDYSVFRLQNSENQPVYFERLFKTPNYLGEFNRRVQGIVVGFLRLYSEDFNAIPALVPPCEEQAKIVKFIEAANKDFEDIRAKIDAEIAMLRELKAITVASAVTGKIKV